MRVIQQIPIKNIVVDRYSITTQTLDLAKKLEKGLLTSPIKVHIKDGKYILTDGRHRITAHKLCGKTMILCKFNLT